MDLLEISKLESGQAEVELASHDLGPLLRRIATDRGLEGIDLDVDAAGTVLVEPRRLERIVSNLIANVHSHGGGHAYLRAVGNVLVVEDDGPGFPDDVLKDGPQRFRSLGHSAGTGLGMTIAVRQAEVMGAQLRLSNRPEGGARAELTLPVT
jgi:signal transduction histidine kinase